MGALALASSALGVLAVFWRRPRKLFLAAAAIVSLPMALQVFYFVPVPAWGLAVIGFIPGGHLPGERAFHLYRGARRRGNSPRVPRRVPLRLPAHDGEAADRRLRQRTPACSSWQGGSTVPTRRRASPPTRSASSSTGQPTSRRSRAARRRRCPAGRAHRDCRCAHRRRVQALRAVHRGIGPLGPLHQQAGAPRLRRVFTTGLGRTHKRVSATPRRSC